MTEASPSLIKAEIEAVAARARMSETVALLQVRLDPKTLARKTAADVTDAGTAAAKASAQVVRRNPGATAGIVAAAGLFLARHRIWSLVRRR